MLRYGKLQRTELKNKNMWIISLYLGHTIHVCAFCITKPSKSQLHIMPAVLFIDSEGDTTLHCLHSSSTGLTAECRLKYSVRLQPACCLSVRLCTANSCDKKKWVELKTHRVPSWDTWCISKFNKRTVWSSSSSVGGTWVSSWRVSSSSP